MSMEKESVEFLMIESKKRARRNELEKAKLNQSYFLSP